MTAGGSQQLRRFRIAVRDGKSIEEAARAAEIDLAEARLHAADDARNPPPPEAYELLGHNSGAMMPDNVSAQQLRQFVERIERLESEQQGLAEDKRDVYAEAKATGFDTKTMRKIVARRKIEAHHATESDMLFATYAAALGMQLAFDI